MTIDEDKFKIDRMEEQMNDINELAQQEIINLRQVGFIFFFPYLVH